ncbi:MAG: VOC family protein [Acidobacteria bacterium]|nr:VOC family protein [Acidobacteriota bacterium]
MARVNRPVPEGFHTATPYLCIDGAAAAIDFYTRAFGARELMRHTDPDGRIRHAQFVIGDSPFMLSDNFAEFGMIRSVQQFGGSPASIFLYVPDAAAFFARALAAGAKEIMPLAEQEYGLSGGLADPFGFLWWPTTP